MNIKDISPKPKRRSLTEHIAAPVESISRPKQLIALLVIAFGMLSAAIISHFVLIKQSIRLDESQSIWQASHSLSGIFHTVALDVHIPLYHVLLHYWLFFFGSSVASLRTMSLIFFLAAIPASYLLARQVLSYGWSLVAVLLFSLSPFLTWYSNEGRMYMLVLFFATLNQWLFLRIAKTGKGWFWYIITAILGAYSHYFFLFNLATQGLFMLFNRQRFPQRSFAKLIGVAALVALALSPWLHYVYSLGSASNMRPHLPVPSTIDFFNTYSQFLFGFQSTAVNTVILSAWPILMLIALLAVRRNQGVSLEAGFVLTMCTAPIILAYVVSLTITPFFLSRYMVVAVAPLIIAMLWLVSKYSRAFATVVIAIVIALTGVSSYVQAKSAQTPVKEAYREVAMDINRRIEPQDIVVLSAPFTIYPFGYYYNADAQIYTLPMWNRSQSGSIPSFNAATLGQDVATLNKNHRYVYLVLSQDQGYEKTISQYYLTHFKQLRKKEYSPGLTLYVYQVGYYTVPPLAEGSKALPL